MLLGNPDIELLRVGRDPRPGVPETEDEKEKILKYLRDNVAPYKVPRVIQFMDELPTSGVGKILKREIKKMTGE